MICISFLSIPRLSFQFHNSTYFNREKKNIKLHYTICFVLNPTMRFCPVITFYFENYPSLLTEGWQAKTLAHCQQLLRRRSFPLQFTLSCTLNPASRWDYLCSLRKEEEVFYCCLASLAQPWWGLLVLHCGSVEFWVTAQPQATAGCALAILCCFCPCDISHWVIFHLFFKRQPVLHPAPPHWHCLQSLWACATGVDSMATTHTSTSPVRYAQHCCLNENELHKVPFSPGYLFNG